MQVAPVNIMQAQYRKLTRCGSYASTVGSRSWLCVCVCVCAALSAELTKTAALATVPPMTSGLLHQLLLMLG